jgi:ribosome-binding protein aMBF1 (putative translation factor)
MKCNLCDKEIAREDSVRIETIRFSITVCEPCFDELMIFFDELGE